MPSSSTVRLAGQRSPRRVFPGLGPLAGLCAFLLSAGDALAQSSCPPPDPLSPSSNMITSIAVQLNNNCWSCSLYGTVYYGMRTMVNATYSTLVSGSLGGVLLAITIVAITLMVRFLPFLVGTQDATETIAAQRMFLFRVSIVFLVFLIADGGVGTASSTIMQGNGLASDFYVDGPLALGTQVAESLSAVTSQALAASTGQPNVGLFGTPNSLPGPGDQVPFTSTDPSTNSFAQEHVRAAQSILMNLHQMGVVGIVTGLWLGLEDPNLSSTTPGVIVVVESSALFLTWTMFMFTLTFGLKYIDALIRAMLIFSLTPFFMYLWIFDSTRAMAVQALKSGLALAGVFAVSGIVFTVAYYILDLGYATTFGAGGAAYPGLQTVICSLNDTMIANAIGATGQGATLNWMAYFYLVGSASMATACASLSFDLAAQIFDFGGSQLGIAEGVKGDIQSGAQSAMRAVRGGL